MRVKWGGTGRTPHSAWSHAPSFSPGPLLPGIGSGNTGRGPYMKMRGLSDCSRMTKDLSQLDGDENEPRQVPHWDLESKCADKRGWQEFWHHGTALASNRLPRGEKTWLKWSKDSLIQDLEHPKAPHPVKRDGWHCCKADKERQGTLHRSVQDGGGQAVNTAQRLCRKAAAPPSPPSTRSTHRVTLQQEPLNSC